MNTKKKPKFLRRTSVRLSKLGKRRKKKQVWRKPTGRDNKMREQRRGKPAVVSIGYSTNKEIKGKIKGKNPVFIKNLKELEKIDKQSIILLGNIGKKKKIEIVKKANELKLEIANLNVKKFLKKNERKLETKDKENKK
ncbi:MAG TPA: eL32 family ribosomal protein [Candidatus Pacearchaeota archaeon]|nr:eL32 family ribosomal protein [Candidatus Pacearchaeota archaeon]